MSALVSYFIRTVPFLAVIRNRAGKDFKGILLMSLSVYIRQDGLNSSWQTFVKQESESF